MASKPDLTTRITNGANTTIKRTPARHRACVVQYSGETLGRRFLLDAHDNIERVYHDKIYRMATIDAGTQIFNKKYLLETLESEFRHSRAYGRPLSIIYTISTFSSRRMMCMATIAAIASCVRVCKS